MARHPQEDLFEGTKMTFGEHIEELRVALFQAILGLAVGVAIGFYVASYVVQFIQTPLKAALEEYYLEKAVDELANNAQGELSLEMITIVREERLAPFAMKVNPESLLEHLHAADPEAAGGAGYRPHRLTAEDLRTESVPEFLAAWVKDGRGAHATPAGALWNALSPAQQREIEQLAAKDSLAPADIRALTAVLNALLDRPTLHQAPELQEVVGPDKWSDAALQELRTKRDAGTAFSAADSRRLNRLLLTAVFPEHVRNPRVRLVDIPFWKPIDIKVQALGAQEAFMIWLKAAFIAGLLISMPWIFLKIWTFVAAGLYPHEKHYVYLYLPISLTLFFAGTALAFFFVFQPVLSFLFSFNKSMNIDPDPRISEWLSFVLFLPLGFGISFQLPLVMLFLQRIGVFTVEMYLSKWRIAILAIFVISMVLTPADPISMLLMACPLSVLYFGGLAMCMWMPRGRNPYGELQAYEP